MIRSSLLLSAILVSYSSLGFSTPAETTPVKVDATSTTASTYLFFNDGILSTSALATDWQISVKRTQFQTNSGTSGEGSVSVANTELTDFAAVTTCAAESFTADEEIPASGAPGSLPFSGNPLLNAWYDYDMSTHTVKSKQHVYLIKDGESCFKFQILDYTSGSFSVHAEAVEVPAELPVLEETQEVIDAI